MSPQKPQPRARTLYANQHTPGQFRPETIPTVSPTRLTAKIGEFGLARQMRRNDQDERSGR